VSIFQDGLLFYVEVSRTFGELGRGAHARTRHSSSWSRRFSFTACRTLLGLCIGARYAIAVFPLLQEGVVELKMTWALEL
jgi:hypothetical protein